MPSGNFNTECKEFFLIFYQCFKLRALFFSVKEFLKTLEKDQYYDNYLLTYHAMCRTAQGTPGH